MEIELFVTPGLGDNTYMVASDGQAALIDPQRDIDRFLEGAKSRSARISHILETHVHNDYLSGALSLHLATGAEIAAPKEGGYDFDFRPLEEGDEIEVGRLRLVALATPGHTPEHLSYLVFSEREAEPMAIFTGGSLMVGGAGRTDLLGPDRSEDLTRSQFRSLRRIAKLPGGIRILPTHGAGSFCGAGRSPKERTSTLEKELERNHALAVSDEDAFVAQQLSGLLAYPDYYGEMAPLNRRGVSGHPPLPPDGLTPQQVAALMEEGSWVVDARKRGAFAGGHIPGSINVELANDFASYVGWVLPFEASLVLVVPEPERKSAERAITDLFRIGYERVEGYVEGGMNAWTSGGREVRPYPTGDVEDLCEALGEGMDPSRIVDVRQKTEWDGGHIAGSRHIFVGDLPDRIGGLPFGEQLWVICASGHRSSLAASFLDREGHSVRLVSKGGVEDLLSTCGSYPAPRGDSR